MNTIASLLPFDPTNDQALALGAVERFLSDPHADAFVLAGAAGTGKTSVTKAITDYLAAEGTPFHVLAPTGRAAMVAAKMTGVRARTVHAAIYTPSQVDGETTVQMVPKSNKAGTREVFLVDEASMLSNRADPHGQIRTSRPPLEDLIRYVKEGHPESKLIFVGDAYQLPPVDEDVSAALTPDLLRRQYGLAVTSAALREVKRQSQDSYILAGATRLRESMEAGRPAGRPAVRRLASESAQIDAFLGAFDPERPDSATMLAWTNRDVSRMNRAARLQLGTASQPLAEGDRVVLQRPWTGDGHWLVGGEQGAVVSLGEAESFAGLSFVDVSVAFDGDERPVVRALALLDVLGSEKGILRPDQERALLHEAIRRNAVFRETRRLSDDAHAGALRLRHGYALTAHKAQGGEWDHVFLHPYLGLDPRWQYTALTRARSEVYSYRHPYPSVDRLTFLD